MKQVEIRIGNIWFPIPYYYLTDNATEKDVMDSIAGVRLVQLEEREFIRSIRKKK